MSSKCKILSIALVALLAFGFYSATTKADVTGSFGLNVLYMPLDCESVVVLDANGETVPLADQPCEKTLVKFDFESNININITISGLTISLHSHLGTTGLEDVILGFATTLGALDIRDTFVFAQAFGAIVDGAGMANIACYEDFVDSSVCDLFFVKKRVEISVALGGVTITNLAILEDLNFPECSILPHPLFGVALCVDKPAGGTYNAQSGDQKFGFGDLIEVSGQTPSGITIIGQTGICITDDYNLIKKHIFHYVVNPDCTAGAQTGSPKPPLFFDFETLYILGVPLATDVQLDAIVFCQPRDFLVGFGCLFIADLTFTGAVIFNPITMEVIFTTVSGPFAFSSLVLVLPAGIATITITLNGDLTLRRIDVSLRATINPDTNPGTLTVGLRLVPGTGLTRLDLGFSVVRSGVTFSTSARFCGNAACTGGGPTTLRRVTFSARGGAGVVTLTSSATVTFNPVMVSGQVGLTVSF